MSFPADKYFKPIEASNPRMYKCDSPAFIRSGKSILQGAFYRGCPGPLVLNGTWGPGSLYKWQDFIKSGTGATPVATLKNLFGLSNSIAMIHWDQNNLSSALNGKFSLEMITGWGSYKHKVVKNDYGWVNGVILDILNEFQSPFIHIYYRKITKIDEKKKIEHGILYFWEAVLDKKHQPQAKLIYSQLKNHIEKYWDATTGKMYPNYTNKGIPEPLASIMPSVFYMQLKDNQEIAIIPSKHWAKNTAYPENNQE